MPNIGLQWPRYVLDVVHEVHNPVVEAPSSTTKERQRLYDLNRHFQDNQVAIHYWAEAIYGEEDALERVLCWVCFIIEGKDVTLASKLDYLWRHYWRKKLCNKGQILPLENGRWTPTANMCKMRDSTLLDTPTWLCIRLCKVQVQIILNNYWVCYFVPMSIEPWKTNHKLWIHEVPCSSNWEWEIYMSNIRVIVCLGDG